jgi:sugar (pentulose or hexulose) kinase
MSNAASFRRIAVLDIGKTNAKVVILDAGTGAEIAARRTTNAVLKSGPYPHYDIDALWAFVIASLKSFIATPGFDAISITAHGASAALLDEEGKLALPVLDYEHAYPAEISAAYDQLRPAFSETFSPRLSGGLNVGAQIHYQKTVFSQQFARVRTILTYPQYWTWRLTGVAANELTSLGCHTDLWNPKAGSYSSLVDGLEIRDLMAPVRSAFDTLGPVLPEIADQIGLSESVPVYCGIHDSNASLLPHLIGNKAPFSVVSTGTWAICFAVGGDLAHLDPTRDTLANVDAYGRAVPSSRFMGGREFEILSAQIGNIDQASVDAALGTVVQKGMMLLPNIIEGSGPFPGKHMHWVGDAQATPAQRHAAVSLYLALMTEACLALIGARGPVFIEGPFALNNAYQAALSSLTSAEVMALPGSTGTSQGAALLTGARPTDNIAIGPSAKIDLPGLQEYRRSWYQAMDERAVPVT